MVGYVADAVANALKKWGNLTDSDIYPVYATDGIIEITNAPIPCIAVNIEGVEGHGNTYIGGGIRQYFKLHLFLILPVINVSFTRDSGKQKFLFDRSDEVINCMEQTTLLDEVRRDHDLNLQFSEMTTRSYYATKGAESVLCQVHDICYDGDVRFDLRYDSDVDDVRLEKVIINNNDINESIVT